MRTAVVLAGLLAFSSTAHAIEWSEWRQIAETESGLSLQALPGAPEMEIDRHLSQESGGARREQWSWGSGQMIMLDIGPGRYMERSTKKSLIKYVDDLGQSQGLDISISRSDIHRDQNKMGNYSYATVQLDDPNMSCFFFVQYFGSALTAGYSGAAGNTANGYLQGVDCQPTSVATTDELVGSMHMFLEGLARQ